MLDKRPELISRPITIDCKSPPLLIAVRTDSAQLVELILALGADPLGKDKRGRDARMSAAHLNCLNSLRYLLDHQVPFDPEARSVDGLSALDYAIVRGYQQAAVLLLPLYKVDSLKD